MATLLRGTPMDMEPLQKSRFFLEFQTNLSIEGFLVEAVGALQINHGKIDVHEMNTQTHVKGKTTYEPITIKFKEHVGPSTAQKLMEWSRLHHEGLTGRDGYAFGYKKNLTLKRLDPTGNQVNKFVLVQCMLEQINFDEHDLAASELIYPTITVQPRYIELNY